MQIHFSDLRTSGKIYSFMNFAILITSIILAFTYGYRILLCGLFVSMAIDYIIFQYFTTEEYWNKNLADRIHKPSRDLFAICFVIVVAALCMLAIGNASKLLSMGTLSLGLMGAVISCVLNEYGIDGTKKDLGIVMCGMSLIGIILLNMLVFRII